MQNKCWLIIVSTQSFWWPRLLILIANAQLNIWYAIRAVAQHKYKHLIVIEHSVKMYA